MQRNVRQGPARAHRAPERAPVPHRGVPRRRAAGVAVAACTAALVTTSLVTTQGAVAAPGTLVSEHRLTAASSAESAGLAPRYAVDGDPSTRWASDQSAEGDQWIKIDLGTSIPLERVVLEWDAAYASAYTVEVSDDSETWTTVAEVTDGDGGTDDLETVSEGRYVQLTATERGTQYGVSLSELQVYGDGEALDPDDPPQWDDEVTHHEFQANCDFSHFAPDDPIVFPGDPGASHLHNFIGNRSTDAFTTPESLFENTDSTCSVPQDHSAYWYPALMKGDEAIPPDTFMTVYYKSGIDDYTKVQPFPEGLEFVTGDMMATTEEFKNAPGAVEGWECGEESHQWEIPESCPEGSELNLRYQAPSCWDGVHLKDEDMPMMSHHMEYPVNGQCPMSHPVPVPMLEFKIAWPVSGDLTDVHLASGADSSWHYDFVNGWEPEVLDRLVEQCINGGLQCNPRGFDQYKPHRGTVLDEDYELVEETA